MPLPLRWCIVVGEPGGEPTPAPQTGQFPSHMPGSNRRMISPPR
ncbi:hypothetical protein SVEN_2886 [Streptomyces venezuelae ATCC 10712]|uniref:Uncharacterized protein n=1 Tax=Streptomyces venezuelae (strain ATCC 10712 / CBS 650.69 / DSM 40230 / JCM 4526 / NBRC 13096 / PD 04745) TaxID=953739 RepID=F2R6C1_STRVP|nr:hypothetical protein SVEN_2886 [Streptomyces venezuelae ATCC 10712]